MIVRVHARSFGKFPAFPQSRRAVGKHITPARIILRSDQLPHQIGIPVFRKHHEEIFRPDVSGRVLASVFPEKLRKSGGGGTPLVIREQTAVKGKRIGGLAFLLKASRGGTVAAEEIFAENGVAMLSQEAVDRL